MAELVMLDLPAGPGLVEALQRVWDQGDAVFPLDQRLPKAEAERVIQVCQPTHVIDADGVQRSFNSGSEVEAGDAIVVATSGTTGLPKAVIHTHASVAASAVATSEGLGADATTDCWLACLPVAHIGGLAVITRSLLTGTKLVVHERFDVEATNRAATEGATLVSLVTRALHQIETSGFRKILIGGAAPPPDLPDNVIATYGMTETGSGCVYGGYPLAGVELRASDAGEIQIKADLLLRAYRTIDGEIDPFLPGGWFPTGDLGHLDPDGRVWIHGRAGDMIITGGENVWPHRIERVLETHPAVAEAAVTGRPDAEWGQRVAAVIVAADPAAPPTLDDLRDFVRAQLPVWNAPKELSVVAGLPKTALGKVRRNDL